MIKYDWTNNEPYEVPEFRPMLRERIRYTAERSRAVARERHEAMVKSIRSGMLSEWWNTILFTSGVLGIGLAAWAVLRVMHRG